MRINFFRFHEIKFIQQNFYSKLMCHRSAHQNKKFNQILGWLVEHETYATPAAASSNNPGVKTSMRCKEGRKKGEKYANEIVKVHDKLWNSANDR